MSIRWTYSLTLGLLAVGGAESAQSRRPDPGGVAAVQSRYSPTQGVAAVQSRYPASGAPTWGQKITAPGGILASPTRSPSTPSSPANSGMCRPRIPVYPPYDYVLPPIVVAPDPGYYDYGPPPIAYGPSMVPLASPDPGFGVAGPLPPRELVERLQGTPSKPAKRSDPARSNQLVTIGDRLFRAGNTRRAAERYEQAALADPNAAAPRIGLTQLALARGDYPEAAAHVRESLTAEPGWLIHAPDISATYGEPADFAAAIAKLESHVQAHPTDRDAWLVLGAQWYLSGQTGRAADVFLRLTDRKADATLEAFLDASASKNQED